MQIKDILKNTLHVYTKNFGKLFMPILLMQLIMFLPLLFFTMPGTVNMARALIVTFSSYSITGTGLSSVFYVFIYMLLVLLFFSPLCVNNTVFVVHKDRLDEYVTFRQSLGFSKRNYGKMIKTYFAAIIAGMPFIFYAILVLYNLYIREFDYLALTALDYFLIVSAAVSFLLYLLGTVFVPYVVVAEKKSGFSALLSSFRYVYKGNFLINLVRLAIGAGIAGLLIFCVNWLSQLPFKDLFDLYLIDPAAAFREPLMVFAISLSIAAIFLVALIMPFWYAFSFNTYIDAKIEYEQKHGIIK